MFTVLHSAWSLSAGYGGVVFYFGCNVMSTLSLLSRRKVYLVALVLLVCCVCSFVAANYFVNGYYARTMSRVALAKSEGFKELKSQVDDALVMINEASVGASRCDESVLQMLASIAGSRRFIYSAAFTLMDGEICTPYAYDFRGLRNAYALEKDLDRYEYSDGLSIVMFASNSEGYDHGGVLASRGGSYVWINKGFLVASLNIPDGFSLDIIDYEQHKNVFSSDNNVDDFYLPVKMRKLTLQRNFLYYADNSIHGRLVSVVSMPRERYTLSLIYASAVCFAFILLIFIFSSWCMFYLHGRYFSMQAKIRSALRSSQFNLRYQPIVDVKSGNFLGAEALLCWETKSGFISPDVFIPIAESSGMMRELTNWVCERVFSDYSEKSRRFADFYVNINLSACDIEDPEFPDMIDRLRSRFNISACSIIFEITERSALNISKTLPQIKRLSDAGHLIAIDDFGTGYSNLSYLDNLPVDIIKLDKSFMSLEKMSSTHSVWWYVVSLARSLELLVVAEGVETPEQAECLLLAGVNTAQGWHYSKPLSIGELFNKAEAAR